MTQIVRNLQNIVKFDVKLLDRHVYLLRKLMNIDDYDISVDCHDDDVIRKYNKRYRSINEPTDVLSFPFFQDTIKPGHLPVVDDPEEKILGDIILGLPYIYRECVVDKQDKLEQILPVMVTHGICHLLGYDHETEEQWKMMFDKEMDILQQFNERTGYSCKPLLGIGH